MCIITSGARGVWITETIEKLKKGITLELYSPDFSTTNFVDTSLISAFVMHLIALKEWEYSTVVLACSEGRRIKEIVSFLSMKLASNSRVIYKNDIRKPFKLDAKRAIKMGYICSDPIDIIDRFLEMDYYD